MKAAIIKSSEPRSSAPESAAPESPEPKLIDLKSIALKSIASFAALVVFSTVVFTTVAFAQSEQATKQWAAQDAKRVYAPRIVGRSNSFIIEGTINSITGRALCVKTKDADRRSFEIDDQTTVFESGELISTATIADVTLQPRDLRPGDRIEIVAERAADKNLARIITRISSEKGLFARR